MKRMRVVTSGDDGNNSGSTRKPRRSIVASDNPRSPNRLTENEKQLRRNRRYATTTSFGAGFGSRTADVLNSGADQFYSPQLSTDFLEKPQNLRERRAFYRFFYHTNEIVGRAVDVHSELPLSKLRLAFPKCKNRKQGEYVFKFFEQMCEDMKLFKALIEISHEYNLFGNCVPGDAQIRGPQGFVRADEVQPGDWILTHTGGFAPVVATCDREADKLLQFRMWKNFMPLPCTGEHPVEVFRNGSFTFVRAEEVTKNDYVRVTWPTCVCDYGSMSFIDFSKVKLTENGYEISTTFSRKRSKEAQRARVNLVLWLRSLEQPMVRTCAEMAHAFGVRESVLNSTISQLDKETRIRFHQRKGSAGFQKGSQVEWFPVSVEMDVNHEYSITKTRHYRSPHRIDIDEDFCYLLGYWLRDGTLARDSSRDTWGRGLFQIVFGEQSDPQYWRIRKILIEKLGEHSIKEWSDRGIRYLKVISNPAFIEWWGRNFGETLSGDIPKRIPGWFTLLSPEKQKHFLAGLVDSDECCSQSTKREASVNLFISSKNLMDSIREIALRCGVVMNYQESRKNYGIVTRDEQSCQIMTEHSIKKIPEGYNFSNSDRYFKRIGSDLAFKVKEIKELPGQRVYNFEVANDHTYQVNGYSTHNCFVFAEDDDYTDNVSIEESSRRKEEARQRSEHLKDLGVVDKDPVYRGWKKLVILPPDQVMVRKLPLNDDVAIEFVPDPETRKFITSDMPLFPDIYQDMADFGRPEKKHEIPSEIRDRVRLNGRIPLDTDPYTGSHVYHLARRKSQYEPLGQSQIERCVNTLVYLDKLRQAQTSIASRHMTPMRLVWAEDLSSMDVDYLREQVDMALMDPDYSIIANYEVHWEEMGSNGRLLDLTNEFEQGTERLLIGLGLTREVLTGEGSYAGSRVSLEIMNQQYLLFRELIQDYVENNLFKPVARKKGFIEKDEYGNETLIYPRLSFTRLAIRDNEQFFDAAFQLHQQGKVSTELMLDILNIDSESSKKRLEGDMWTINDPAYNELMRNVYTNAATGIVEQTDLISKLADYMGLEFQEQQEEAPEGAARFASEDPDTKEQLKKVVGYFMKNPDKLRQVFKNGGNSRIHKNGGSGTSQNVTRERR